MKSLKIRLRYIGFTIFINKLNTLFITKIDINDAKAGDLLFWSEKHTTDTIQHVGFFLDAEHCIDSATGKGVAIRNITSGWYKDNLVAVGKIPGIDN